ncbi:unnamed protein product [Haemonchus placei]|uniref:DUF1736 domain-containing protein n=1 Tax=Haemonchus placei TaxID=6290 RepID=A0A158QKZ5_HAEPC|nr:unnamed protein product [Haemonchus placei]
MRFLFELVNKCYTEFLTTLFRNHHGVRSLMKFLMYLYLFPSVLITFRPYFTQYTDEGRFAFDLYQPRAPTMLIIILKSNFHVAHPAMQRLLVIFIAMLAVLVSCQREQLSPEMSRYFMDDIGSSEYVPSLMKGSDSKRKHSTHGQGSKSTKSIKNLSSPWIQSIQVAIICEELLRSIHVSMLPSRRYWNVYYWVLL